MVPFLLASTKRNELGRASGRSVRSCCAAARCRASTRLPASGSLFFAGPKKSNQKKGPMPRRSSPRSEGVPGFSDSASCVGRKTPHIHVRRPSGLASARARPDSSNSISTSNLTADAAVSQQELRLLKERRPERKRPSMPPRCGANANKRYAANAITPPAASPPHRAHSPPRFPRRHTHRCHDGSSACRPASRRRRPAGP